MIVIPMAGLSSRFKVAGYQTPKYMLEARGRTLFEHSVSSFETYFKSEKFLFITLIDHDSENFIRERCLSLGIQDFEVVVLESATLGQAHTVYLGLRAAHVDSDEPILIFNIDTFRAGYEFPEIFNINEVDGYLETFVGRGKNWSNVLPRSTIENTVERTAEKQEISQYCCTGIYYFNSAGLFTSLLDNTLTSQKNLGIDCELFIAPLYNDLIDKGMDIRYTIVPAEAVLFCGIPEEYIEFLAKGE